MIVQDSPIVSVMGYMFDLQVKYQYLIPLSSIRGNVI